MTTRKRQLVHFPEKYAEIARSVGLGQVAVLHTDTESEAQSIRFEFNTWRSTLRRESEKDPSLTELLTLAESVLPSLKKGDTTIYFRHRETVKRALHLNSVQFFPSMDAAIGGSDGKKG